MSIIRGNHIDGRYIQIDLADYVDLEGVADAEDMIYLRDCLEAARRCLNRPERSPAEAINHIEDALHVIAQALK